MNYIAVTVFTLLLVLAALATYIALKYKRDIKEMANKLADLTNCLENKEKSYNDVIDIACYVALNLDFEKTLEELLPKLRTLTNSTCCAFYMVSNNSKLTLKHSVGFSKNVYREFDLTLGEGFIGSLALEKGITIVYDVPEDTIYMVRTFLGMLKPRNLMVTPVSYDDQLAGVFVCASIGSYTDDHLDFIEKIRYFLGIAVGNGINDEKNKRLHNEMIFQNKLIQNQHEEMRRRLKDKEMLINHLAGMVNGDVLFVLDSEFKILFWSDNAKDIYNIQGKNVLGRHIDHVHRELGWEPIQGLLSKMQQSLMYSNFASKTNGESHLFEMTFTRLGAEGTIGFVARAEK